MAETMVIDGFYKKINEQNEVQHYKFKDTALTEKVSGIEERMAKHLDIYDEHKNAFASHVDEFAAVQERLGQADFKKFHFVYDDYLGTNGGVKLVFDEEPSLP